MMDNSHEYVAESFSHDLSLVIFKHLELNKLTANEIGIKDMTMLSQLTIAELSEIISKIPNTDIWRIFQETSYKINRLGCLKKGDVVLRSYGRAFSYNGLCEVISGFNGETVKISCEGKEIIYYVSGDRWMEDEISTPPEEWVENKPIYLHDWRSKW